MISSILIYSPLSTGGSYDALQSQDSQPQDQQQQQTQQAQQQPLQQQPHTPGCGGSPLLRLVQIKGIRHTNQKVLKLVKGSRLWRIELRCFGNCFASIAHD